MGKKLKDLYLIGLGILPRKQLTEEARELLKRCRIVLHIAENHRWMKELSKNVVDLKRLYFTGEVRNNVYDNIRRRVHDEIAKGPGVALVTYGHPLVFDSISTDLREECRRRRRSVEIISGISSLDTLAVDLGFDYADGIQIYEASRLVWQRQPLNNRVNTLLYQIGEYDHERTADVLEWEKPGRYASLIKYLRRFYPASHPVTVAFSDDGLGLEIHRMKLRDIDKNRRKIFAGTTLYIPPTKRAGEA